MQNLTLLVATPFIASLVAFIMPLASSKGFKALALLASAVPLLLLLAVDGWVGADLNVPWMPALHINFHLGIDSLSLVFLYLTALVIPVSIAAASSERLPYPNVFYGLVFLLEGLLFAFFMAKDLAIFAFFWESMLIPLYFIITLWGKQNRQSAALKFLVYMIAGSCLMVAGVLALFVAGGSTTFDIGLLAKSATPSPYIPYAAGIFLLAFAVKTPLFPFHAWLPDAYCQASTPGTILLAAILSKAGIYGLFRLGYGIFPSYMLAWSPLFIGLAIAGVLYGGLAAWRQDDFKRLIAYSSLSHVNFILAGVFIGSQVALEGAILQAVNHGITIAALFLAVGWLEERLGTTAMGGCGGLATCVPMMCWVTFTFVLSSVALPATNSFVGELLILFGAFGRNPWLAFLLALSVVLSVIYMLRFMQKVYFGEYKQGDRSWTDLRLQEWGVAIPLIALIFWIGIYPTPFFKRISPAAESFSPIAKQKDGQ